PRREAFPARRRSPPRPARWRAALPRFARGARARLHPAQAWRPTGGRRVGGTRRGPVTALSLRRLYGGNAAGLAPFRASAVMAARAHCPFRPLTLQAVNAIRTARRCIAGRHEPTCAFIDLDFGSMRGARFARRGADRT